MRRISNYITSVIGKRLEHITSQRLIQVLKEIGFDMDQYAYLPGRSSTQAILTLVERIKSGLLKDQYSGAVFFDFTDAFGSVDRSLLLEKIRKNFSISGLLFAHIRSFLTDRTARIMFDDSVGQWLQSIFGTSAGTRLGPILFVMYIHDVPNCIKPKYADDLVALSVGPDLAQIEKSLQHSTDRLVCWANQNGMSINSIKTKAMLFGDCKKEINICIDNSIIERVTSYKYLGVVLDTNLDFGMQVDYAVGKAKRTLNKICSLIKGRKGLSIKIGIDLYKSLVRPHLEYAIAAWASISDKDVVKLERVQVDCLRRIIGAKAHSSSSAVEVVCGIVPFRFRKRELCCREYIRIQAKSQGCELRKLMESSTRVGLRFCPLEYIKTVSRELHRHLDAQTISGVHACKQVNIPVTNICILSISQNYTPSCSYGHITVGSFNASSKECAESFIRQVEGHHVCVYTDGSVYGQGVGSGACSAVMYHPNLNSDISYKSSPVGSMVSIDECEIDGIILGIDMIIQYHKTHLVNNNNVTCYILSDSISAIEHIDKIDTCISLHSLKRLKVLCEMLVHMGIQIKLVHIPAHSALEGNMKADKLAKDTAFKIASGEITAPVNTSAISAFSICSEITRKSWQRSWDNEHAGRTTHELIPTVYTKILFPVERDIGISYCRLLLNDTMLKDDSFRSGTSTSPICDCGSQRETAEHLLFHCTLYKKQRDEMVDQLQQLCWTKRNEYIPITYSLLLSPNNEHLSKHRMATIKAILFKFLSDIKRAM